MNTDTKMRPSRLATNIALATVLTCGMSANAFAAALPAGTILTITPGSGNPTTLQNVAGSYFVMGQGTKSQSGVLLFPGTGPGLTLGATTANGQGDPTSTAIVAEWVFFGVNGYNRIDTTIGSVNSTAPSDNGDGTFNMGAWTVNWGGSDIDMSAGSPATFTCTSGAGSCANGDSYALHYTAVVPTGSFTGVQYDLYLAGKLSIPGPNTPPLTQPDSANVTGTTTINVLANDVDADGLDPSSVAITTQPKSGSSVKVNSDGTITYTPGSQAFSSGSDSFQYTVADTKGAVSSPTTVTLTVAANSPPVANNDSATVSAGGSVTIDVTKNDTDVNDNLDPSSVVILSTPANGTVVNNHNGTVTYTNNGTTGPDSFTYQVSDTAGGTSQPATVNISVSAFPGDASTTWNSSSTEIPVLFYQAGVPGSATDSSVPAKSGSYFTMEVQAGTPLYTMLTPGPAGGIVIGQDQPASGSHSGAPDGTESPGIDEPWNFFGNTGMHYTKNGGIIVNSDGTLDFSNRWFVTWNGIPAINMGGCSGSTCPAGVVDSGKASIACTPSPCADGSQFTINYKSHVPLGDPSGFGGVPYGLHMTGTVGVLSSALQTAAGSISAGDTAVASGLGERMTADQLTNVAKIPADTGVEQQCVGGCFDFKVTGISGQAQVVLPLSAGVPNGAGYRKYMNGQWQSFNTSGGDTVKSAPYTPGTGSCPAPGSSAYRTLTPGDFCLELTIADNGPNDSDTASGTVADPGGLAVVTAAPAYIDTRTSGSSGCSINPNPVAPGNGGAWLIVGGFIAWLGVAKRIRRRRTDRSAR